MQQKKTVCELEYTTNIQSYHPTSVQNLFNTTAPVCWTDILPDHSQSHKLQ